MSTSEPRAPLGPLPPADDPPPLRELYAEAFEKAIELDRPDLVEELIESIAHAAGAKPRRSHA